MVAFVLSKTPLDLVPLRTGMSETRDSKRQKTGGDDASKPQYSQGVTICPVATTPLKPVSPKPKPSQGVTICPVATTPLKPASPKPYSQGVTICPVATTPAVPVNKSVNKHAVARTATVTPQAKIVQPATRRSNRRN